MHDLYHRPHVFTLKGIWLILTWRPHKLRRVLSLIIICLYSRWILDTSKAPALCRNIIVIIGNRSVKITRWYCHGSLLRIAAVSSYYILTLRAKFFRRNKYTYLHFMSFLHTDMTQVVEILPQVRPGTYLFYRVSIMGADALATQGARASATMILT